MSYALAPVGSAPIDTTAEDKATKSTFTPFISLLAGQSKAVLTNEPPGARAGTYLFAGRKVLESFIAIPTRIASRPRASFRPKNPAQGDKIESNDPDSHEWAKVKEKRASKDVEIRKGAKIGVESLMWLPEENSFGIFSFSNSAQKAHKPYAEARNKGSAVKIRSKLKTSTDGSFNWFEPIVEEVTLSAIPKMPTAEQIEEAVTQFQAYKGESPAEEEGVEA